MKKIDRVFGVLIAVLCVLIGGVIWFGNYVPVRATCQSPAPCTQVSPLGALAFEFSRPVDAERVEKLWRASPSVPGTWEWSDDRHARWKSTQPLPADGSIRVEFVSGQAGKNGEWMRGANAWDVSVRAARIAAIGKAEGGQELFVFDAVPGSVPVQLTHSEGRLYDFAPASDGETVLFSAVNDQHGLDLWSIRRDGTDPRRLLDCGTDRCSTPAQSPVSGEIAFTREGAGSNSNSTKSAPAVWILDPRSGLAAPLFAGSGQTGSDPHWSPDGRWISFWMGLSRGIQVIDRNTGVTIPLEASDGDTGCWSPDGRDFYYSKIVSGEAGYHYVIMKLDVIGNSAVTVFGGNLEGGGLSVDNPVCDPSGVNVAVTVQPNVQIPGKRLIVLSPNTPDEISVADDLTKIPGSYAWDLSGSRLVYQLVQLSGPDGDVTVWIWNRATGRSTKIADGYGLPAWLP
jgi:hypothetical protein